MSSSGISEAILNLPNAFSVGPQTIQTGADANVGLILKHNYVLLLTVILMFNHGAHRRKN